MKKVLFAVSMLIASCSKKEETLMYVKIVGESSVSLEKKSGDLTITESDTVVCSRGEKVKYNISSDDALVEFWLDGAIIEDVHTDIESKEGKFKVRL